MSLIQNKRKKRKLSSSSDNKNNKKFLKKFNISEDKSKKTLKKFNKANLTMLNKEQNKSIDIFVNSETSNSRYIVKLLLNQDGIHLECNCGNKFGIEKRKNCKHISTVLFSQFKNYINSITDKKSDLKLLKLEDLFNSLNI